MSLKRALSSFPSLLFPSPSLSESSHSFSSVGKWSTPSLNPSPSVSGLDVDVPTFTSYGSDRKSWSWSFKGLSELFNGSVSLKASSKSLYPSPSSSWSVLFPIPSLSVSSHSSFHTGNASIPSL